MSFYKNTKKFSDIQIDNSENMSSSELIMLKIAKLSESNAAVIIHINKFCDLLQSSMGSNDFVPMSDRATLQKGYYGTFNGMVILVNKKIPPEEYKIGEDIERLIPLL